MKSIVSIITLTSYVLIVTGLMFINTTYLNLGDDKWAKNGWMIYWWLWTIFYSPILTYLIIVNWKKNSQIGDFTKWNLIFILVLSPIIEVSFIYDITWYILLVEYLIIAVSWHYLTKKTKTTESVTGEE